MTAELREFELTGLLCKLREDVNTLLDERDALRAELAAARERLAYVERNMRCDPDMGGNHKWWRWDPHPFPRGPTFIDAIDAARAEGKA